MKTKLHTYDFNLGIISEHQAYTLLKERMMRESRRRDRVNFVSTPGHGTSGTAFNHLTKLGDVDGVVTYEVELDVKHLFDDQWNTVATERHTGYRVFDWVEYFDAHNRNVIWGHWLEVTDEMVEARQKTRICGYCEAHYGTLHEEHLTESEETPGFCKKCLGSQYLKEDELHLLRLVPITAKRSKRRDLLTDDESALLMPRYLDAQLEGDKERRAQRTEQQRAQLERQRQLDEMKFDGMTRLLNAGIDLSNVIFHDHHPVFKFGWRSELSPSVAEAMQTKLAEIEFPHPTEFVIAKKKK
jgi:hypothetical protein